MSKASRMQADNMNPRSYFYGICQPHERTSRLHMNHPKSFRTIAVITLLNVLVASGFSIAGLIRPDLILPPGAASGGASVVFAMYAAARALPLAGAVLLAVVM